MASSSDAAEPLRSALRQRLIPVALQWGEQEVNDAAAAGLDVGNGGHAGLDRGEPFLGLQAFLLQRDVRDIDRVAVAGLRTILLLRARLGLRCLLRLLA